MQQVERRLEAGGDGFEGAVSVVKARVGSDFGRQVAGGLGEVALLHRNGGEQGLGLGDDGRLVAADAAQLLRIGLQTRGLGLPGAEAIVDRCEGGESLPLLDDFIAQGTTATWDFQHLYAPIVLVSGAPSLDPQKFPHTNKGQDQPE